MLCPAPMLEEEKSPQLQALLAEDRCMVPTKEQKQPRERGGLCVRDASEARSEETHAFSTHEGE